MEKRYLFVRQRLKLSAVAIAAAAVSGSLVFGLLISGKRPAFQGTSRPRSQQMQHQKEMPDARNNSALVPLPTDGLSKPIAQLKQEALTKLNTFSVPARFQGQVLKSVKLAGKEKPIALTFDDGPWPRTTVQILKILKKNNIKATFFMVGQPLQEYPQLAKLVVADGHAIANHTWHHWYRKMDSATAAREIEDTAALIYKTTGVRTSIFRPPGGILNNGLVDYAKKRKDFVAMWSADSIDYRPLSAAKLIKNVVQNAQPGGMVLLHDGGGNRSHTVQALPKIIADLKKRGYKFVTVPELLEMQDSQLKFKQSVKHTSPTGAVQKSPLAPGKKPQHFE